MLLKLSLMIYESFLGGLLYATFPIVLTIFGVGFSDLSVYLSQFGHYISWF